MWISREKNSATRFPEVGPLSFAGVPLHLRSLRIKDQSVNPEIIHGAQSLRDMPLSRKDLMARRPGLEFENGKNQSPFRNRGPAHETGTSRGRQDERHNQAVEKFQPEQFIAFCAGQRMHRQAAQDSPSIASRRSAAQGRFSPAASPLRLERSPKSSPARNYFRRRGGTTKLVPFPILPGCVIARPHMSAV